MLIQERGYRKKEVRGYYRIEVTYVRGYCGREVTTRG
jgi:hypothetical protein